MHRKRVTCELHDSYFRSMTIKNAIPKTAEMTHPDGQLWGDIKWAIELLYNSVETGSQLVWRPDPLVTRCGRESEHPAEWASRPPVEHPGERERKTDGGGSICCSSVRSPTPSHTQTFQIKWEVYFSKRLCRSSFLLLCRYDSECICIYIMCLYSLIMVMAIRQYKNMSSIIFLRDVRIIEKANSSVIPFQYWR